MEAVANLRFTNVYEALGFPDEQAIKKDDEPEGEFLNCARLACGLVVGSDQMEVIAKTGH